MGVGISLAGLASAVANVGGIGVIAAAGIGMYERDFYSNYLQANTRALRREIRKAKLLTGGILAPGFSPFRLVYPNLVPMSDRLLGVRSAAGLGGPIGYT